MILCSEELAADINRAVFPGQQGGPLMHIIAAKAVALKIAQSEQFKGAPAPDDRQRAGARRGADRGRVDVLTGGTDVHLVLVDLTPPASSARTAEDPPRGGRDHRQPQRDPVRRAPADGPLGPADRHPALTTRGLVEDDMREIAQVIVAALDPDFEARRTRCSSEAAR